MKTKTGRTSVIAAMLAGTALCGAASAEETIIFHNWSAGPEVAALNVLKENFEAMGHTWTDIAIPHDTGSNVSLLNLVTGGNPPKKLRPLVLRMTGPQKMSRHKTTTLRLPTRPLEMIRRLTRHPTQRQNPSARPDRTCAWRCAST